MPIPLATKEGWRAWQARLGPRCAATAVVAVFAALGGGADSAWAATASVITIGPIANDPSYQYVTVQDQGSEANDITVELVGGDVVFSDANQPVAADAPCMSVGDSAACPTAGMKFVFVYGAGGADKLSVGAGVSAAFPGFGPTPPVALDGGDGNDELHGGPGRSQVFGGLGDDKLDGGPGDDRIAGGSGADTVVTQTGDGNDSIDMGADADHVTIAPDDGNDSLDGGAGDDTLEYLTRPTTYIDVGGDVAGAGGESDLVAADWETIQTGDGNDTVVVRPPSALKHLSTGGGNDTFRPVGTAQAIPIDLGGGTDTADFSGSGWRVYVPTENPGHYELVQCDNYYASEPYSQYPALASTERVIGGQCNDTIKGDATINYIDGQGGADDVNGGAGDDELIGGPGADSILGGPGIDHLDAYDATVDNVTCGDQVDSADVDVADNVFPDCESVRTDHNPPETTFAAYVTPTRIAPVELSFSSTEDGSTFECRVDDGQWSGCSAPLKLNVAEGSHTVLVRATDPAGNTDPTAASASFVLDTTAPAPPTVSSASGMHVVGAGPAVVQGTAEPGATVKVSDNGQPAGETIADTSGAWSLTLPFALGSHDVIAFAVDAAGNESQSSMTWTRTVDPQPPPPASGGSLPPLSQPALVDPTSPLVPPSPAPTPPTMTLPAATAPAVAQQTLIALRKQLTPSGKAATIAALRKSRAFHLKFKALSPGKAVVSWYHVPKGAKLAKKDKPKPVLVATGKATFTAAGTKTITVRLTSAGKRLLKRAKKLKLTARGTFTPTGKSTVSATKTFTLKR